jgi:hypothetical protein
MRSLMKSVAPIWPIRQNCSSPGLIATVGFDLPVDRDYLVFLANLRVLDEEEPFWQVCDDWEDPLEAVDDQTARHAAKDLLCDEAMSMRVIPEEAGPLVAVGGNTHLVLELLAGVYVEENIVAIPARRHAHAVKMQIRWNIQQLISKGYSHRIAKARPEHRGHVRAVIKKTRECKIAKLHTTGRSRDRCPKNAIFAANFWWGDQRLPPGGFRTPRIRQPRAGVNERNGWAENFAGGDPWPRTALA